MRRVTKTAGKLVTDRSGIRAFVPRADIRFSRINSGEENHEGVVLKGGYCVFPGAKSFALNSLGSSFVLALSAP